MTAEDHAAIRLLLSQAGVIKEQMVAMVTQVEALELQAKALGRRLVEESRKAPEQKEPKSRHYGAPQKVS
jgi:hypothetical protein